MFPRFDSFYTTKAVIAEYKIDDYTGEKERKVINTISADVQPYSGGKANEKYGIEIECQKRMFCDVCPDIDFGKYLEIDGEIYEVTYVEKWTFGLEVMLKLKR